MFEKYFLTAVGSRLWDGCAKFRKRRGAAWTGFGTFRLLAKLYQLNLTHLLAVRTPELFSVIIYQRKNFMKKDMSGKMYAFLHLNS